MIGPDGTLQLPGAGIPLPHPTAVSQPFWDGCAVGELRYQRCANGHAVFIPTSICRECLSQELTWEVSTGQGEVYSWSVVWRPQTPEFRVPYAPVIVDVDEGFQILSNLVGCDVADIRAGLRVAVEFHAFGDMALPYFRPVAAP